MIDTNYERWGATLKEFAPTEQTLNSIIMGCTEEELKEYQRLFPKKHGDESQDFINESKGKLEMRTHELNIKTERINTYTCPKGHVRITRDVDEGTTPLNMQCDCGLMGKSAFYRVSPWLEPTHEWYKPKHPERLNEMMREHVEAGGLLFRKIGAPDETDLPEAEDNGKPVFGYKINLPKHARFASMAMRALTNSKRK
ncbi:hypothetical protein GCM10028810_01730 [Spirosoma litoris]